MDASLRNRAERFFRSALFAPAALGLALTGLAPAAGAVEVTGSFTGWWDQPDQQNHGLIVAVSKQLDGANQGVVYWANYDDAGNPTWFIAQGPIRGDTIDAELYKVEGVTFMQAKDPAASNLESVGTMQVQFSDCGAGDVSFDTVSSIVGTGGFRIARLSNQPGTVCSGGLADNIAPTSAPEEFTTFLVGTSAAPAASGKVEFEALPGRADFEVQIEDLPTGSYALRVGGVERGQIDVIATPGGNQGEIEFRSPVDPGKILLDFDPRDQIIEVLSGTTVVLEGATPENGDVPGADLGTPPPFGEAEVEVDLNNSGTFADASGDAELEQRAARVDFDVEIEDVPPGSYNLLVAGVARGTIEVRDTPAGPEGEIEFRFPAEAGKLPLNFDPRGALIEVADASGTILSANFPAAGGDDQGEDGDDDDDDDDDDDMGGEGSGG